MVARASLVSLVALFIASAALISLLPLVGDLLWGPEIVHPPPSRSERIIGWICDVLFCSSVVLAYFVWLQRRTVPRIIALTSIAIAGLTLLSPLLIIGRYLYSNPVFDPASAALQRAFPWLFLAALVMHPQVRAAFGEPRPVRFSVRWLWIVAAIHAALFVGATCVVPSVVGQPIETFLLFPTQLLIGLIIRLGAWRTFSDSTLYSTAGPPLEILVSSVVWGCIFALIYPHTSAGGRKPSN